MFNPTSVASDAVLVSSNRGLFNPHPKLMCFVLDLRHLFDVIPGNQIYLVVEMVIYEGVVPVD